jgi:glycerophosphoryl diester phosphodiesterase
VTLVIGHKGAAGLAPENSVAAFRVARDVGADGVELDVRRLADGALAVHHDPTLDDGRRLLDLAAGELPDGIATLPPVLDACDGLTLVNVEIKNWPLDSDFDESLGIVDSVVEALEARPAEERERYVVSCFHLPTVDRARELAPDLVTAWLVAVVGPDDGAQVVAEAVDHGHRALHPHHALVTRALVERAHDEELAVNAWTCNEPDRIRWLADEAGVDGIVTDVPDVALAALGRAGPGSNPRS